MIFYYIPMIMTSKIPIKRDEKFTNVVILGEHYAVIFFFDVVTILNVDNFVEECLKIFSHSLLIEVVWNPYSRLV